MSNSKPRKPGQLPLELIGLLLVGGTVLATIYLALTSNFYAPRIIQERKDQIRQGQMPPESKATKDERAAVQKSHADVKAEVRALGALSAPLTFRNVDTNCFTISLPVGGHLTRRPVSCDVIYYYDVAGKSYLTLSPLYGGEYSSLETMQSVAQSRFFDGDKILTNPQKSLVGGVEANIFERTIPYEAPGSTYEFPRRQVKEKVILIYTGADRYSYEDGYILNASYETPTEQAVLDKLLGGLKWNSFLR